MMNHGTSSVIDLFFVLFQEKPECAMAEGDLYEGENKMTCCLKKGKHHLKCIDAYHGETTLRLFWI